MECKEEIHSDDGSWELIDDDDVFAGDMENLNMKVDVSSNMDASDDGSYDFLCSEVSETLVLSEGEASDSMTVSEEIKSVSSESTNSDPSDEEEKEVTCVDFPDRVYKSKKRNFMAMLYENSNFDPSDFPHHIKIKEDMKEIAKGHILRYLPAKSLASFKLVSKEWALWISSPFFAHMQSQYFKKTSGFFEYHKGRTVFISLDDSAYGVPNPCLNFLPLGAFIKSSCNGLLLCEAYGGGNEYYVCNPANKEWIKLPSSSYYHGTNPKMVLAFEPSSLNFKPFYQVVCPFSIDGPVVYFDIYDSNTQSWRISDMLCVEFDESGLKSDGYFMGGLFYWETTGGELLAVDLKNEIYGVQKLPDGGGVLSKVYGELCYVKAHYQEQMRICILSVYGDGMMSLKHTMAIDISVDGFECGELVDCEVLGSSCDDAVSVIVKKSNGLRCLYVYHVKDQHVQGPWFLLGASKLFPYVNSLVTVAA